MPWALLGDLATRRGEERQAQRYYRKALRLNPRNAGLRESVSGGVGARRPQLRPDWTLLGIMPTVLRVVMALTCALCLPTAAAAQERAKPDPDSPAGVEYQLPLDQAREDASGERARGRQGRVARRPCSGRASRRPRSHRRQARGHGEELGRWNAEESELPQPGARSPRGRYDGTEALGLDQDDRPRAPRTHASVSLIAAAVLLAGAGIGLGAAPRYGSNRRIVRRSAALLALGVVSRPAATTATRARSRREVDLGPGRRRAGSRQRVRPLPAAGSRHLPDPSELRVHGAHEAGRPARSRRPRLSLAQGR